MPRHSLQEPGSGIAAVVGGRRVAVGNDAWLQRALSPASPSAAAAAAAAAAPLAAGATRVFVAADGHFLGTLDLRDAVRGGAAAAVAALRRRGVRTVLLTGDAAAPAAAVGAALGFPENDVFSGVRPEGKLARVEALRAAGARVAMVGDGINDTAALAAADVGVAMAGGVQVCTASAPTWMWSCCPTAPHKCMTPCHVLLNGGLRPFHLCRRQEMWRTWCSCPTAQRKSSTRYSSQKPPWAKSAKTSAGRLRTISSASRWPQGRCCRRSASRSLPRSLGPSWACRRSPSWATACCCGEGWRSCQTLVSRASCDGPGLHKSRPAAAARGGELVRRWRTEQAVTGLA